MQLILSSFLVFTFFIFSLFLNGCHTKANDIESVTSIPVKTKPVLKQQLSSPIHTSGILSTISEVRLSFKVGGIIEQILVDEGDRVKKGKLLAILNQKEISAKMMQAQSGFEKAERSLNRLQKLYADSVVTLEQMQDAETAFNIARANLDIAIFNLEYSKILAPADGKILKRFVEENELIGVGNPVFIFGSSGKQWIVRVGVTDKDIINIQKDDSASIYFDVYPDIRFPALVKEIAEFADKNTGTFELEIEIPHNRYKLISGFVAKVDIYPKRKYSFYIIPIEALIEAEINEGSVFAFQNQTNKVKKIPIKISHIFGEYVAVSEGLEDVSYVVTDGAAYLADGSSVMPVD
jgi:RND family efflux transporter MFP subunit